MTTATDMLQRLTALVADTADTEIDCGAVLDLVAGYLEASRGERPAPATYAAVEQHLSVCPDCLEEFRALVAAVDGD